MKGVDVDGRALIAAAMADSAAEAALLMKALANEGRLLILCHLIDREELPVQDIAAAVGLSQSAVSQHLAKLRKAGLVCFRRDAQTLYYRICDQRAANLLMVLHDMFCQLPPRIRKTPIAPLAGSRENSLTGD
jgi:DNA-binding transcriptional ArsR family regulator